MQNTKTIFCLYILRSYTITFSIVVVSHTKFTRNFNHLSKKSFLKMYLLNDHVQQHKQQTIRPQRRIRASLTWLQKPWHQRIIRHAGDLSTKDTCYHGNRNRLPTGTSKVHFRSSNRQQQTYQFIYIGKMCLLSFIYKHFFIYKIFCFRFILINIVVLF